MTTLIENLRAVQAKIERPENWTQSTYARDAGENDVNPLDPAACRWCLIGAIRAIFPDKPMQNHIIEALFVETDKVNQRVPKFNDTHTHAEVLALLDRAIAAAEGAKP